jgi:hypothetical protein
MYVYLFFNHTIEKTDGDYQTEGTGHMNRGRFLGYKELKQRDFSFLGEYCLEVSTDEKNISGLKSRALVLLIHEKNYSSQNLIPVSLEEQGIFPLNFLYIYNTYCPHYFSLVHILFPVRRRRRIWQISSNELASYR